METATESTRATAAAGPVLSPSRGEALHVWRKRRGLNQVEAAEHFEVHPDKYRDWEADRGEDIPRARVGRLRPNEVCTILRRRKGMTQAQLANELGCTRLWINQMESGEATPDRLLGYWGIKV